MTRNYSGDILIVDDMPNNLRFLSTTLAEQGYKVRSVTEGLMALTVAEAAKPDLILLDIRDVQLRIKNQPSLQTVKDEGSDG